MQLLFEDRILSLSLSLFYSLDAFSAHTPISLLSEVCSLQGIWHVYICNEISSTHTTSYIYGVVFILKCACLVYEVLAI